MMKKILFTVFILLLLQLSACVDDPEIKVIKAEAWNNLMPGAEAKTHFVVELTIQEKETKADITSVIIKYEEEEKKLNSNEYEYKLAATGEVTGLTIQGGFPVTDKDLEKLSVEIDFLINGNETQYKIDDIKVEKVY